MKSFGYSARHKLVSSGWLIPASLPAWLNSLSFSPAKIWTQNLLSTDEIYPYLNRPIGLNREHGIVIYMSVKNLIFLYDIPCLGFKAAVSAIIAYL